jgi:hypothetical protein
MRERAVDLDRVADLVEVGDPDADEAGANPGRGERAGGDSAAEGVDADPPAV